MVFVKVVKVNIKKLPCINLCKAVFYSLNYKLANFSNKRIIWQVKPYSLSYQATVFTNWKSPAVVTSVCVGSKIEPSVVPIMSPETISRSS